ncbi:hypothetical protein MKW94_029654 [Papaver nudicaule]|uniref:Uncharacterized protein n=1 Tax=Papaver nudicaule TaxID=74823 RepID=A0AA41VK89_PAPNU|nr:hypothetical protein [Papaver nudicaule]
MSDTNHSTSDDTAKHSTEVNTSTSQNSKHDFMEDEEILIAKMHSLVGNRWSLIAGRIPGRTAEEIEKYWTSRHSSSRR